MRSLRHLTRDEALAEIAFDIALNNPNRGVPGIQFDMSVKAGHDFVNKNDAWNALYDAFELIRGENECAS